MEHPKPGVCRFRGKNSGLEIREPRNRVGSGSPMGSLVGPGSVGGPVLQTRFTHTAFPFPGPLQLRLNCHQRLVCGIGPVGIHAPMNPVHF